jgi:hypothetical protein
MPIARKRFRASPSSEQPPGIEQRVGQRTQRPASFRIAACGIELRQCRQVSRDLRSEPRLQPHLHCAARRRIQHVERAIEHDPRPYQSGAGFKVRDTHALPG